MRELRWREAFLEVYRRTGQVAASADLAGTTRQNVYRRLKKRPELAAALSRVDLEEGHELAQRAIRRTEALIAERR